MADAILTIKQNSWLETLRINPIPVLLNAAPLPIRFQIMRDILEDSGSEDFLALQKNLRKHKPRRKRLAEQRANGLWTIKGSVQGLDGKQIETLQFIRQLEVLHELLNLMVTQKQEKINRGMREVIRYLAEKNLALRCHHLTQAIHLAISFKLDGNPIIKQLIREMLSNQNKDGGWSSLSSDKESCYWSSLYFMWSLGQSNTFRSNRRLHKGLDYLKTNLLLHDQSNLLSGMQVWDTLISGTTGLSILTGGTLRYLETWQVLGGGERDRKLDKLLNWLIDIQLKNGLWPSIVDRDKQGDHSVTLRVLKVLKYFQTQRLNETLSYESN